MKEHILVLEGEKRRGKHVRIDKNENFGEENVLKIPSPMLGCQKCGLYNLMPLHSSSILLFFDKTIITFYFRNWIDESFDVSGTKLKGHSFDR